MDLLCYSLWMHSAMFARARGCRPEGQAGDTATRHAPMHRGVPTLRLVGSGLVKGAERRRRRAAECSGSRLTTTACCNPCGGGLACEVRDLDVRSKPQCRRGAAAAGWPHLSHRIHVRSANKVSVPHTAAAGQPADDIGDWLCGILRRPFAHRATRRGGRRAARRASASRRV